MYACDPTPQIPPCTAVTFKIPSNRKPCVGDQLGEVALTGKVLDGLHKVLVQHTVARKDLTQ